MFDEHLKVQLVELPRLLDAVAYLLHRRLGVNARLLRCLQEIHAAVVEKRDLAVAVDNNSGGHPHTVGYQVVLVQHFDQCDGL